MKNSMAPLCDFCGEQRSMVYCRSDAASLCLSCDQNVHSANALSRRHMRTFLCEKCMMHPAIVRCIEENASLCQNCDWNGHGGSGSASRHKKQQINCYSGCPSIAEFSRMWTFIRDFPPMADSSCERGMGLMTINENSVTNCWGAPESSNTVDIASTSMMDDTEPVAKFNPWIGSCSASIMNPVGCTEDQPVGSADSTIPQLSGSASKDVDLCKDGLYEDFTVDDVDLTFENYEEFFGSSHNKDEDLFDDAGIESFFDMKETSANSNCQGDFVAEASSAEQPEPMQTSNNAVSADSAMLNPGRNGNSNLIFPARQAISSLSLSFSGMTGESSAGDYQDCGVSSMILTGEHPWHPSGPENLPAANRHNAVKRYREKRNSRKFDKKIRYESRKARADVRKRVKGRFVKAGEAYDYDPLSHTRSC